MSLIQQKSLFLACFASYHSMADRFVNLTAKKTKDNQGHVAIDT